MAENLKSGDRVMIAGEVLSVSTDGSTGGTRLTIGVPSGQQGHRIVFTLPASEVCQVSAQQLQAYIRELQVERTTAPSGESVLTKAVYSGNAEASS